MLPEWSGFPEAVRITRDAVAADPLSARWGSRLFVLDETREMVGWGGFKGAPVDGTVEVGYAIAPAAQGRGLATQATLEMLAEAYADPEVRAVIAHTRAERNASVRVLEKAGFAFEEEVSDPDAGSAWRFRHTPRG